MERLCQIAFLLAFINLLQLCSAQQGPDKALSAHNEYRAKHKAPALKLDSKLNDLAKKCAKYYAGKKTIDHTCTGKGKAGENLFSGSGMKDAEIPEAATKMWYDEVKDYNYGNPVFAANTGHFTQVVWKASAKLGFAQETVNGFTVAVGLYEPAGNMQGDFKDNVLQP